MKIWILDCDVDTYENFAWGKDISIDFIHSFDGRKKMTEWQPIAVARMYKRVFSNTPGLSPHIPVFDEEAIRVLSDLLVGNAEILPLKCKEGNYFAINVINILDCIDHEKSEYETFRDGKRIMRFTKYVLDEKKINGVNIFKTSDEPLKRPMVSDEFRERVLNNNLTGFKFELAWDSGQE